MKIKEVEAQVGITRANIRYYEKEGLLEPARDTENNYRDYSEADVERLKKIKVLRILGVPIADIHSLTEGKEDLSEVMERRLLRLDGEEQKMKDIRKACETVQFRKIRYEELDEQILESAGRDSWKEQFKEILTEDITKEYLTPAQLNRNIAAMLFAGYFFNGAAVFVSGNVLDTWWYETLHDGAGMVFAGVLLVSAVCYMSMYFTNSIKLQFAVYMAAALCLTPFVTGALYLAGGGVEALETVLPDISGTVSALRNPGRDYLTEFWLSLALYVLFLYGMSAGKRAERFWGKARHVLFAAAVWSGVCTILLGVLQGRGVMTAALCIVFTLYIGLSWLHVYREGSMCSRYYAVVNGSRILNIGGVALKLLGLAGAAPIVDRRKQ